MKAPGSEIVHYVDRSAHCVPALVRAWHNDGKVDMTIFTRPGAVNAVFGVECVLLASGDAKTEHSWHHDCPNEPFETKVEQSPETLA